MDKLQKRIILKALDNEDKLTEWEVDYVNDLADKPDDYSLSKKQNEILMRIWNKVS